MEFRRKVICSKKLVTFFAIVSNKFNADDSVVHTAEEKIATPHMEKVHEALYRTILRYERGWVWMCQITQGQRWIGTIFLIIGV